MPKNLPARLESEEVVLASPMSFTGSARRLWKLARGVHANSLAGAAIYSGVILLIAVVWVLVLFWYFVLVCWWPFALLGVLYRLIRRGQRKDHMQELRHREILTTIHQIGREVPPAGDGLPPARTRDLTGNYARNEIVRDEDGSDRPTGTAGPADA